MEKLKLLQIKTVFPIAYIVTFLGFLDTHMLIPVMALYASGLGASVGTIGLIVGLYSIVNTPANVLFGRLIDRVGYKWPLVFGLLGDALGMFLYSICRLPIHLGLVRAFHGMSGASVGPATMSLTAEQAAQSGRGKTMGFYGMSLAMATLVGYGLSGVFASRLGYRAVFLFGSAMLVVGVMLALLMPSIKRPDRVAGRTPLSEELRKVASLLKRRGLIASYCPIFAQYFTFGGVVTLLPIYVKGLGMEAFHVGMLLATFAIMFILLQFPSGNLSDRVGRLLPTTAGLSLSVVSLVALPSLGTFPLLAIAMALYGTAYGLLFPSISALIADHTVPQERGTATGLFHALLTAGVAIGAPVMGWVGGLVGTQTGLALCSGVAALALVVVLTTLSRRKVLD